VWKRKDGSARRESLRQAGRRPSPRGKSQLFQEKDEIRGGEEIKTQKKLKKEIREKPHEKVRAKVSIERGSHN